MIELHAMTVLIVDDSMSMCQSVSGMMKVVGLGKRFLYANNGKEALDILSREPVDLMLLDYNMPVMTGAEVLAQIRMDRKLRDLPVIMVTAEAYQEYVAEVGESEIDAYILKPLTVKVLQDKISLVVDKANHPPPMIRHLKTARELEDAGDLEGAIREAQLAVRENPKATRPIRELGYFYFRQGAMEAAEKFLLKAAERNRLDVFAFHYLGELYLQKNDIDKASLYLEKAMRISPRQLDRGIRFGKVLVRKGMLERAEKVFSRVFELPSATPELREEVADFCLDNGATDYAVSLLEALAEEFPKRMSLLFKLGRILTEKSEYVRATTFLNQAAQLDEMNIQVRLELARVYLAMKKPLLAEKPLIQILEVDRGHEEARELLKACT
ncbi:MAG: response regulator [Desulfobacteraceae bacterium]|jgi:CheY-like chemotaxis protein